MTFAAKDIYDVAGQRTGFGSPEWFATHGPAAHTAPTVQRLIDAGADLVGKTHTDELTYSLDGQNAHYGAPVNVNAPGHIVGGSSSGSAAAVAASLIDFALGSDTGGSVRVPASYCGVFGIRASHGRISLEGTRQLAPTFDTAGWFARDARVLERVGRVLLGGSSRKPGRLLLASDAFEFAGESITTALLPGLARLRRLLGPDESVSVADEGLPRWCEWFRVLQGAEAWSLHGDWISQVRPRLGPGVKERFARAALIAPDDVAAAKKCRQSIERRMNDLLAGDRVLAIPTTPHVAPRCDSEPAALDVARIRALSLLCIAGLARLPQISIPIARQHDCPLGISLIAARGNDELLLALAAQVAAG